MTLIQLKYILTIAETKSLNKAAEQLYVSQPSLTNALKELEKEIGITIFFRSGRGVTLTNDGVEFLTYARELYHEYEQLSDNSTFFTARNRLIFSFIFSTSLWSTYITT